MADDVYVQMAREWLEKQDGIVVRDAPLTRHEMSLDEEDVAAFAREVAARTWDEAERECAEVYNLARADRESGWKTKRQDMAEVAASTLEATMRRRAKDIRNGK